MLQVSSTNLELDNNSQFNPQDSNNLTKTSNRNFVDERINQSKRKAENIRNEQNLDQPNDNHKRIINTQPIELNTSNTYILFTPT